MTDESVYLHNDIYIYINIYIYASIHVTLPLVLSIFPQACLADSVTRHI